MRVKFLVFFILFGSYFVRAQNVVDSNTVKELFFAGLKEKLAENYSNAISNFKKVLDLDSKNDAAYFEIANLSMRQNKLIEADIAIKQAVAINPNNIWYLRFQAELYKRNGNMTSLVKVFDQMISLNPDQEDFYFDRANALFLSGNTDEALKAYNNIELKFGTSAALTSAVQKIKMKGSEAPSGDSLQKLIDENPKDIQNYLYLSGVLLEKNKVEDAITLLQKAKLIDAENFEIDLSLANAFKAQRREDLAMEPLKRALAHPEMPVQRKMEIIFHMMPRFNNPIVMKYASELAEVAVKAHPNEPKLFILNGDILYQQGNLGRAKEQYQASLLLNEQYYPAWEKVLAVQTLGGQYQDAIKTGEDALALYPNQAILYYYRAFALHRLGQNAEAGLEIKSALQLDPDDNSLKAMIFALQAEVYIDQQKLKEADLAFDKSITLEPDNYLTLSNYAYYLALRNYNLTKAESLAAKAANAMPQNSSVADTYAFVLLKLEKYTLAKTWIERALQNNEGANPVYLEHYGDILFLKGEQGEALVQWKKAKEAGNASEKLIKKINERKYFK